jgi:hypothetical protein
MLFVSIRFSIVEPSWPVIKEYSVNIMSLVATTNSCLQCRTIRNNKVVDAQISEMDVTVAILQG